MSDPGRRTYPHGVPCWVDTEQPDPDAAARFYRALFGWDVHEAMPVGAPGSYLVATLGGQDVGALAPGDGAARWNTYIACDDADATAARVEAAGGVVLTAPADAGPAGRTARCADPDGAVFSLWQAGRRLGAQLVNSPGSWNFSDLLTPHPDQALAFYAVVFGWETDGALAAGMVRVPGYGDHLAATVDPEIHRRQAFAPPGFADAVAGTAVTDGPPSWHVRFTVVDRDASVAAAESHGATVLSATDTQWTREALVRDPQGAELTLSQFTPPGDGG